MGEMADDLLDQIFGGSPWSDDHEFYRREPRSITCRYCGKRGQHWEKDEFDNSYLADRYGVPHVCADRVADASEFPCIS